jgi:hypothetical protein
MQDPSLGSGVPPDGPVSRAALEYKKINEDVFSNLYRLQDRQE